MLASASYTIVHIIDGLTKFHQYAKNASYTTAPITGWSAVMPASEAGKFIWSREGYALTYDEVSSWGNAMCLTGATGSKGDTGNTGAPGIPGTDAKSFQIIASPPTFAQSSRGVVTEAKTITLYCVKANIPESITVSWTASNLTPSSTTGNSVSITVPVGFEATEISISCTVSGFPVQALKIMGVKAGDPLPVYLGVLSDPDPVISNYFAEAGGKFITGDFYLYQTSQVNYPKWFDGVSWSIVDKSTPNYSQICSTVLADSLKQTSTVPSMSAIYGFFGNLAASNGFFEQLSANNAFISNFISNLVTVAYALKSGGFDAGMGFRLDAEDGSFQILSGSTSIRIDPQNGILVQVGGVTAFQVKLDGSFIFQNNIMAITQGSGDLYKNIVQGTVYPELYNNIKSNHRSGLLSTNYGSTFSAAYAKQVLVASSNVEVSLGGSETGAIYIAGLFKVGNTIRLILTSDVRVRTQVWNNNTNKLDTTSTPLSFGLMSTDSGVTWSVSTVGSGGYIKAVTRKFCIGVGWNDSGVLICSYGSAVNSIVNTTYSYYYRAYDGWTYDNAVRFMILVMKRPVNNGIGALVLIKKMPDNTTAAHEEVSLNGLVADANNRNCILDIDGSNAVIFGLNGYVIVSNNLTTCSPLKTDLLGGILGFMYVGNTLYVQASEGGQTYKVTASGIVAFSCAFIKEPIEVDGVYAKGVDFASAVTHDLQKGCALPRTGSTGLITPFTDIEIKPVYDYNTGSIINHLYFATFAQFGYLRTLNYSRQSVTLTPTSITSTTKTITDEMLTINGYNVIISNSGLGVGFSLNTEIPETFEFKSPMKVTTIESSGIIMGYVNGNASGPANSYKVWGAVAN